MDEVVARLSRTPAVREGRVYVADGNAYFNRPGPRLVDSAELAAAAIHPELFAGRSSFPAEALFKWPV
jgi:iron complex transport system substrate-binding protein